jgi:hypothetical protein
MSVEDCRTDPDYPSLGDACAMRTQVDILVVALVLGVVVVLLSRLFGFVSFARPVAVAVVGIGVLVSFGPHMASDVMMVRELVK